MNFTINWGTAIYWLVLLLTYALIFKLGRTSKKKTFDKGYIEGHRDGLKQGRNFNTLKDGEFDDEQLFEFARKFTRLLRHHMDSSSFLGKQVIVSDDLLMYAHEEYKLPNNEENRVLTGWNIPLMETYKDCIRLGEELHDQELTYGPQSSNSNNRKVSPRPPASWGKNSGSDTYRPATSYPNSSGNPAGSPAPATAPSSNGFNGNPVGNPTQVAAPVPNGFSGNPAGSPAPKAASRSNGFSGNPVDNQAPMAAPIPNGFSGNPTGSPAPMAAPVPNGFSGNPAGNPTQVAAPSSNGYSGNPTGSLAPMAAPVPNGFSGNPAGSPAPMAASRSNGFSGNPVDNQAPMAAPIPNGFSGNPAGSPAPMAASRLNGFSGGQSSIDDQPTQQADYSMPYAGVQASWEARQRRKNALASGTPSNEDQVSPWFMPQVMPGQRPTDIPPLADTSVVHIYRLPPRQ